MQRARADRPSTGASSCSVEFVVVIVESRLLRESLIWRKALPFLAQPRYQLSSEWRFAIASARLVYPPHRSGRRGSVLFGDSSRVRRIPVELWSRTDRTHTGHRTRERDGEVRGTRGCATHGPQSVATSTTSRARPAQLIFGMRMASAWPRREWAHTHTRFRGDV